VRCRLGPCRVGNAVAVDHGMVDASIGDVSVRERDASIGLGLFHPDLADPILDWLCDQNAEHSREQAFGKQGRPVRAREPGGGGRHDASLPEDALAACVQLPETVVPQLVEGTALAQMAIELDVQPPQPADRADV
jgi:hypothetical protein